MTDETSTHWHLLVIPRKGPVSMLKNLDAPTARQAYQRLKPDERPTEWINVSESRSWCYPSTPSDIEAVHILGPDGVDLEPWRGVEPRVIDLAKERDRQAMTRTMTADSGY